MLSRSLPQRTNLTSWTHTVENWYSAPDRSVTEYETTNHTYSNVLFIP
jgi:hypothetical protein